MWRRTPRAGVRPCPRRLPRQRVTLFRRKSESCIEQGFGWAKTVGGIRQVMVRGLERVDQMFVLTMAAYNLTRMRTLEQIRLQGQ